MDCDNTKRSSPTGLSVIARSESDPFGKLRAGSAISCKEFYSWDCFVAFAPRNDF
ncbi:MAG: hypothetical protein FWC80_05150 [Firmicutes bacterium]|nr:hypothetical protein [Bacillota bacterium]